LKACRLVTGAAAKRNRFIDEFSPFTVRFCRKLAQLVRKSLTVVIVSPTQFIHQMIEVGRGTDGFRRQILLQPLAHGVANRSAGLAIDPFVVGDSAVHNAFLLSIHWMRRTSHRTGNCFSLRTDCMAI
jgi:hypothetical protein